MIRQINTAIPMPQRPELDATNIISRKNREPGVERFVKIAALCSGIALCIATIAPRDSTGPQGLKGKVAFGLCCLTSSVILNDFLEEIPSILDKYKQNLAERRSRNV